MSDITKSPLWAMRYAFFSRFDEWIQYDEVGFHSTKPEEVSRKLWNIVVGNVVFDGFCWLWSNAIGFALSGKKVITCDIDADRLKMAQNNARIYGVEDRITFIHGSVLDHISSTEYDVAYFDPPWSTGGVYYFDKWKFSFSDYGVDGLSLIRLAKQKTNNIVFALPKNFDLSELDQFWTDVILTREMVQNELFLYTLFLDPNNNVSDYKDSIVPFRNIDKTIQDTFVHISEDLPDYGVRKIVYNNTLSYLRNALLRTPEDKNHLIYAGYSADMERIIDFCQKYREQDDGSLTIELILWLHKTLYPVWYVQKYTDSRGQESVWMVPGAYRKIDIHSQHNTNNDIYLKPPEIRAWMRKIVQGYNNRGTNILDDILYLLADFFIVHPFGDGNGRVAYILVDLLLLDNGLQPLYLGQKKENDKIAFYKILDEVSETRSLKPLYEFIEKYS